MPTNKNKTTQNTIDSNMVESLKKSTQAIAGLEKEIKGLSATMAGAFSAMEKGSKATGKATKEGISDLQFAKRAFLSEFDDFSKKSETNFKKSLDSILDYSMKTWKAMELSVQSYRNMMQKTMALSREESRKLYADQIKDLKAFNAQSGLMGFQVHQKDWLLAQQQLAKSGAHNVDTLRELTEVYVLMDGTLTGFGEGNARMLNIMNMRYGQSAGTLESMGDLINTYEKLDLVMGENLIKDLDDYKGFILQVSQGTSKSYLETSKSVLRASASLQMVTENASGVMASMGKIFSTALADMGDATIESYAALGLNISEVQQNMLSGNIEYVSQQILNGVRELDPNTQIGMYWAKRIGSELGLSETDVRGITEGTMTQTQLTEAMKNAGLEPMHKELANMHQSVDDKLKILVANSGITNKLMQVTNSLLLLSSFRGFRIKK